MLAELLYNYLVKLKVHPGCASFTRYNSGLLLCQTLFWHALREQAPTQSKLVTPPLRICWQNTFGRC